jgi:endonuclease G, mitochondrial
MADNSTVLPACQSIAHFLEFFCVHGTPENLDAAKPVTIAVNQGYAAGFSPSRLQPIWAAYQVSAATKDLDFERPEFFYDDPRLPPDQRIGAEGFKHPGTVKYDRGHMVPNFAINTQFGRIAQFETFFMSNIIPQEAQTNRGAWKNLEQAIIKAYAPLRKHVWAITGPIFSANPALIARKNGLKIPIPEAYFLVLADPERFPYDDPNNLSVLALKVPADHGKKPLTDDLVTTLDDLERLTQLRFFPRLSAKDKAKVKNQTSPIIWPFEKLAAKPNDPVPDV